MTLSTRSKGKAGLPLSPLKRGKKRAASNADETSQKKHHADEEDAVDEDLPVAIKSRFGGKAEKIAGSKKVVARKEKPARLFLTFCIQLCINISARRTTAIKDAEVKAAPTPAKLPLYVLFD